MADLEDRDGAHGPGGGRGPDPAAAHAERRHLPLWQEMVLLLGLALLLAVLIKSFFLQAFYIPSGSMNDTLVFNDRILVQKVSYWGGGAPQRGDIVVFEDPANWLGGTDVPRPGNAVARGLELFGLYPTGGHLVKRVVAVGGDTVACCDEQGRVTVNGVALNERAYLAPGVSPSETAFEKQVPEGFLWVMGDNRAQSADSRAHTGDPGGGFVSVEKVVGRVFAVVWPLDHAQLLGRPATFESLERP